MSNLASDIAKKLNRHAPTILTIVGSLGIAATAYFAHQAGVKSARDIDAEKVMNEDYQNFPMSADQKVRLVWPNYLIPTSIGVATVVCFITANTMSVKRQTAILGAYTFAMNAYSTYREKMVENLGEETERVMSEDIAQERAAKLDVPNNKVLGDEEYWIEDAFSGQIFASTPDTIRRALDAVNEKCIEDGYASLNYFYDFVGARSTDLGTLFGWTESSPLDLVLSPVTFKGGVRGFGLEFRGAPSGHFFAE